MPAPPARAGPVPVHSKSTKINRTYARQYELEDLSHSLTSNVSTHSASCDCCTDCAWRFQELEFKISQCRAFLVAIGVFRCKAKIELVKHFFEAHCTDPNYTYSCPVARCTHIFKLGCAYSSFRSHINRKHHDWKDQLAIQQPTVIFIENEQGITVMGVTPCSKRKLLSTRPEVVQSIPFRQELPLKSLPSSLVDQLLVSY